MHIVARTSNRLFVGLPLCEFLVCGRRTMSKPRTVISGRNPEYRKLNETFAIEVIRSAQTINKFPKILKPCVNLSSNEYQH